MQRRPIGFVKPITRVERQEFDFRTLREGSRFIENQAPIADSSLDRHEGRLASGRLPNKPLQPTSGADVRVE